MQLLRARDLKYIHLNGKNGQKMGNFQNFKTWFLLVTLSKLVTFALENLTTPRLDLPFEKR